MMPDKKSKSDLRTSTGGRRLIIGGIITVALVAAIFMLFAGRPDPQRGESLPNAPPQGEVVR